MTPLEVFQPQQTNLNICSTILQMTFNSRSFRRPPGVPDHPQLHQAALFVPGRGRRPLQLRGEGQPCSRRGGMAVRGPSSQRGRPGAGHQLQVRNTEDLGDKPSINCNKHSTLCLPAMPYNWLFDFYNKMVIDVTENDLHICILLRLSSFFSLIQEEAQGGTS